MDRSNPCNEQDGGGEPVCISLSILPLSPGSGEESACRGYNRRVGNESKCIRRAVMISKRCAGYLGVEGVCSCLFFHLKEHSSRILQTQRHEKSISRDSLLTSSCSRIQICMRTVLSFSFTTIKQRICSRVPTAESLISC